MTSHRKIEKKHIVRNGAVALTSAAILGTGTVLIVEQQNQSVTQSVRAASYDINGYIKKNNIQPKKTVVKDLHSFSVFDYSTPDKLPNGIVFHWTASESLKDSARAEADYEINGGWHRAFVHTFIDDNQILNIHDTNKGVWGAGPKANARFVQFEMCTAANQREFAQTISNAAYYTASILYQYGLKPTLGPNGSIWTHHQVTTYLGGTTHVDPDEYLSRWNYNTSKFLTIVKQYYAQMVQRSSYAPAVKYDRYVKITSNKATMWRSLDFSQKQNLSKNFYGKILHATVVYGNSNGSRYLSLYDNNNKWVGYLNQSATELVQGAQGPFIRFDKYVSFVKNNVTIWKNFNWVSSGKTSGDFIGKTFDAKIKYNHFNGSTYYGIYDHSGKSLGLVNSNAVKIASTPGGVPQMVNKYVSFLGANYSIWKDFSWKTKLGTTNDLNGRVVRAQAQYNHFNGTAYYTLYDSNNKWLGYVNANGATETPAQGKFHTVNKYVTLTNGGYSIWNGFDFKTKLSDSKYLLNRTYRVQCEYNHFDGNTYYSIYNNEGKWQGYVDSRVGSLRDTPGGAPLKYQNTIEVKNAKLALWDNFDWTKKKGTTANLVGKNVFVKCKYNHLNGSTYYSIYTSSTGKWLGYVNADVVAEPEVTVSPIDVPSNMYGINTTGWTKQQLTFAKSLISYAIPVSQKYGLYPSIIVAQGIKESGWGTSELATKANAYFGVKADDTWTGNTYTVITSENGDGRVSAAFRKYSSLAGSVEGYARNVVSKPNFYAESFRANAATWQNAVQGLKAYATSPTYLVDLTKEISNYKLNNLDAVK